MTGADLAALTEERRRRAHERGRSIQRVLLAILVANWAVAIAKVVLGQLIDSTAVSADGLHSFIDGGSNVIGLVAMRFAARPADEDHPYGHQKLEALAALAIGVMIGMGALEVGRMAVDSLVKGIHPTVEPAAFAVMVGTVAVNLTVTRVEGHYGKKLNSTLLMADAKHTLTDVFVSVAVIGSLVLSRLGVGRADGLVALGVIGFIGWTGWVIISRAVAILSDSARLEPEAVRAALAGIPDVLGVRDIRSRGLEDSVYVDLKLDVAADLSTERAHTASDAVEGAIARAFPNVVDVVVHVEPKR